MYVERLHTTGVKPVHCRVLKLAIHAEFVKQPLKRGFWVKNPAGGSNSPAAEDGGWFRQKGLKGGVLNGARSVGEN